MASGKCAPLRWAPIGLLVSMIGCGDCTGGDSDIDASHVDELVTKLRDVLKQVGLE